MSTDQKVGYTDVFETDTRKVRIKDDCMWVCSTKELHAAGIKLSVEGADAIARALAEWSEAKKLELDRKHGQELAKAIAEVEHHEERLGLSGLDGPLYRRLDRVIDTCLARGEERDARLKALEDAKRDAELTVSDGQRIAQKYAGYDPKDGLFLAACEGATEQLARCLATIAELKAELQTSTAASC